MSENIGKIGWIDLTDGDAVAGGTFCVIEDPSGATSALYQP